MDNIIKQYAIQTGLCSEDALYDPESYDNYRFHDSLTKFVELVKKYYICKEKIRYIDEDIDFL